MNETNEDIQPEPQPTPETPETAHLSEQAATESATQDLQPQVETEPEPTPIEEPQVTQPEPAAIPEKTEKLKADKKPPSKFQIFLRKALIGLGIIALVFLAGFLTDHYVRYQPLSEKLDQTQAELETANQTIADLESENDRLTTANRTATNEIAALEEELTAVRANALFYQVLVDVNTARINLFLEDIEGAQAALEETQDNLDDLLPFINDVDPELALSLPRRLDLIVSGLARDPETGLIDLELFTKDLLALEPLLIGE
jgi:cell division protein FtsB